MATEEVRERARKWMQRNRERFINYRPAQEYSGQGHGLLRTVHLAQFNEIEAMATFAQSEREAEMERCCADLCSYCRDRDEPERRYFAGNSAAKAHAYWVHTMIGFDDRTEDCNAGPIRERWAGKREGS